MNWTEPKPPLGIAKIEWKGWKEYDSYLVFIGDTYYLVKIKTEIEAIL